jgi:hypothetical protein
MDGWKRLGLAFAVVSLGSSAAAGVLVVDAAGGGAFTDLQLAINAAQDGDTLLVKAGTYETCQIDNKSLTIVADSGSTVVVEAGAQVLNLAPSKRVVLSGLRISGTWPSQYSDPPGVGLSLTGNSGPVRIEDCRIEGGWGDNDIWCTCISGSPCSGAMGVTVISNPAGVAFVGCTIYGGSSGGPYDCYCDTPPPPSINGNTGLYLEDGLVALYDCQVHGGSGGGSCHAGGNGGDGAHVTTASMATTLVASDCTFNGGYGGGAPEGGDVPPPQGGNGGAGLVVDSGAYIWRLDTTFTGGLGGSGSQSAGINGQAIVNLGVIFPFAVPHLKLTTPSVVRELQTVPLTVHGRPGDDIYLYMSQETPFRGLPSWHGVQLATYPPPSSTAPPGTKPLTRYRWILGTIPASGVLDTSFSFPDLGANVSAQTWFLQAWRHSPVDGYTLGSFRALTVLDSAY